MQAQTAQVITSIKLEEIFVIYALRNKWEKIVVYCHIREKVVVYSHVQVMAYIIYSLLYYIMYSYKYNML